MTSHVNCTDYTKVDGTKTTPVQCTNHMRIQKSKVTKHADAKHKDQYTPQVDAAHMVQARLLH